jgi:hypothetical protein
VTRLRITPAEIPGRRLDQWDQAVDPTDVPTLMQILTGRRAARPDWSGDGRLAIEAYHPRRGWLRYEQPI